jgi:hypothetical protein
MQIDAPSFGVGVRPAVLNTIYPVGSGPSTPTGTGNVYHLPANILLAEIWSLVLGCESVPAESWFDDSVVG